MNGKCGEKSEEKSRPVKMNEPIMIMGEFSMNDAEIIVAAGLGVAMGNAEQALKDLTNLVCDNYENEGISKTLQNLGLI